jgi:recombinational DNA repair protein RecT
MAEEPKNQNQIAVLDQKIAAAKDVKELFMIPDLKERFIKNYQAVSGRKDGENRLEQERFAYLQMISDKPELQQVEKFYHAAALIYAGTTGLSFRNGKLYAYPNGKGGIKVQPSPAGKREMLEMMNEVEEAPEAILVMKGDLFIHDKLNHVVKAHETTKDSVAVPTLDNIVAAYQRIYYKSGKIRDTVVYHHDLVKAKSSSKTKQENQESNWNKWAGEMSKKTATNRAFDRYHRFPDNIVLFGPNVEDKEVTDDVPHADVSEPAPPSNNPPPGVDGDGVVHEPQVETKKQKRNLLDD